MTSSNNNLFTEIFGNIYKNINAQIFDTLNVYENFTDTNSDTNIPYKNTLTCIEISM